jgi:hypothetical protein
VPLSCKLESNKLPQVERQCGDAVSGVAPVLVEDLAPHLKAILARTLDADMEMEQLVVSS